MKKLIILPFAEIDIMDTLSYYNDINTNNEFIRTIDNSFNEILKSPEAFPIIKYDIRKYVVAKFSFCIFYVNKIEAVYILAVFHDKRNPKVIFKRKAK